METPAPVDLNKLKSILGNAKKVMQVAEEKFPSKKDSKKSMDEGYSQSNHRQPSTPIYDESDEREPEYRTPSLSSNNQTPKGYTKEQVMASNLPPAIKEAMIKNPIPQMTMSSSKFSLEDLQDIVDEKPKQKTRVTENQNRSTNSDMITISRAELDEMIENKINEVLVRHLTNTISEQAIKKTIKTLMSEGKITAKKKI